MTDQPYHHRTSTTVIRGTGLYTETIRGRPISHLDWSPKSRPTTILEQGTVRRDPSTQAALQTSLAKGKKGESIRRGAFLNHTDQS